MSVIRKRRPIAKEVLGLLKDHSPLTLKMIQRMISPAISKKDLRQSIGILKRRGMVEMLVGDSQEFFYQLNQARPSRIKVSTVLHCEESETARRLLRRQDWFHNQWCEFWSLLVRRAFPSAEIIREHNIEGHRIAKSILQQGGSDLELMPDFVAIIPGSESQQKLNLAFEIERTRKSDTRILKKLKTYIYETHIDGLIYVCDSGRLSETIRLLYQQKAAEKSHKKSGYVDNFFLFSDSMTAGKNPLSSLYNAVGEPTDLVSWIGRLRSTKQTLRRDAHFKDA